MNSLSDIRLIYHTTNLSPKVTEDFLASQAATLPLNVFQREHSNLWGSGSDIFCELSSYQRARSHGNPLRHSDEGPCTMFADLSWAHDESVLATGKLEDGMIVIVDISTFKPAPNQPVDFGAVGAKILELKRRLGITQVIIESAQGVALSQQLNLSGVSSRIIHPTAKSQRETWGALYGALRDQRIWLPPDELLRRQLLSLTIKSGPTGWSVIDHPQLHQDRAMAVAGVTRELDDGPQVSWADLDMSGLKQKSKWIGVGRNPERGPRYQSAPSGWGSGGTGRRPWSSISGGGGGRWRGR
jgi:hypothetical protein